MSSTRFNLENLFVCISETPGEDRLAIMRLSQKADNGEQQYQIIRNNASGGEYRSAELKAEEVMNLLVRMIDIDVFARRRRLRLKKNDKDNPQSGSL